MRSSFLNTVDKTLTKIVRGSKLKIIRLVRKHLPPSLWNFSKKYPSLGKVKDTLFTMGYYLIMKLLVIFVGLPLICLLSVTTLFTIVKNKIADKIKSIKWNFWK